MQDLDAFSHGNSNFQKRDKYDLLVACQALYEQTQALSESVEAWLAYLKSPEERELTHPAINPTLELEEGLLRFLQAIKKESTFLQSLLHNEDLIEPHHVNGSNFPFLEAVYHCARREEGLVTIFKPVRAIFFKEKSNMEGVSSTPTWEKLRIDVVSHNGLKWTKVSARNARGVAGQDPFSNSEFPNGDTAPLQNKARLLQLAASQNQVHFKTPQICFQFACICSDTTRLGSALESLFTMLLNMGVLVEEVPYSSLPGLLPGGAWRHDPSQVTTPTLNLDITTLLALCSQLTHLGAVDYTKPAGKGPNESLRIQLEQEKVTPILPFLVHLTNNRTLTTTQACYDKFMAITSTIAGPTERLRAYIIFRHHHEDDTLISKDLSLFEDDPFINWKKYSGSPIAPTVQVLLDDPSQEYQKIFDSGTLRSFNEIHLKAFGTGHKRQMTSLTANVSIARSLSNSATSQGPSMIPDSNFFIIHEPRSFTENKLLAP